MANNIKYKAGAGGVGFLFTKASVSSGDVVNFVDLVVLALEDTGESVSGKVTCMCPFQFVADIEVVAENNSGNVAVAIGDLLYYDGGTINKDSTNGVEFGYALEAIASGSTDTILVGFGM